MTETEMRTDEVDLSAEEEPAPAPEAPPAEEGILAAAGGPPEHWAGSAGMEQPAMADSPPAAAPMGPAPDPRPEKPRLLIRLGNLFCGGPNG